MQHGLKAAERVAIVRQYGKVRAIMNHLKLGNMTVNPVPSFYYSKD
jgi:hypothetical protein